MEMFGIPTTYWLIGAVLLIALEMVLVWAVTALGDCPSWGIGKITFVAFLIAAASMVCLVAVFRLFGAGESLWAPEQRATSMALLGGGLIVSWAINSIIYSFATPWSVAKCIRQSLIQLLLRAFLAMLIGAILMVLLAWLQISLGKELRTGGMDAPVMRFPT